MSGCCNEPGCTRKKPIMLSRGELSGAWFVVTDYTERENGGFVAKTRHVLNDKQSRQLDEAFGYADNELTS